VLVMLPALTMLSPFTTLAGLAVGASVARDAVVDVSDTLFGVFGTYIRRRVLVATETRVARNVVVDVARRAGRVVVAVEQEEPVVVEG
jgi:hypothetical protein